MKILYGVAGEGFGHSSRALVVGNYLERKGHKVKIVTYGQAYDVLKDRFDIFRVKGLHLIFEKNVLKKRKTLKYNAKNFSKNFKKWKEFHEMMDSFNPDLCVSDMEIIVPVLSNLYNLPLISLDNQHRLTNLRLDIPKKHYKDFLIAKEVVKTFVRKAEHFVITSFANSEVKSKYKENTTIVPPIIREEVQKIKSVEGDKFLVYLTKKNKRVLKVLRGIDEEFVVYGYNKKRKKGNLEFKVKESFLDDLKKCKAVIATAGFTLMSEAIYLKKPYLALPLKGQFEQVLNAIFLKEAGFGNYSENLTVDDVKSFLGNIEDYRKRLKTYNPNYNQLYNVLDNTISVFQKRGEK
jgi:uncharacterized protein (TIGR00661 family)